MILFILVVFVGIFLIEVFHDDIHRKIRNKGRFFLRRCGEPEDLTQDNEWSNEWHLLDWISWFIISLIPTFILIYLTRDWFYLTVVPMIGSLRVLILNIVGNLVAQRKIFYLGNGKWDRKFKGKEILYHIIILIILILSICTKPLFLKLMS